MMQKVCISAWYGYVASCPFIHWCTIRYCIYKVGTLPRSGGRQLVCLDSIDLVLNSYTCNIPEGVRLVLGQLSYYSRLVLLRCYMS